METPDQSITVGPSATVVTSVQQKSDLSTALANLNLTKTRPTIVIIGGASHLSDADHARIKSLFVTILAPLAEELGFYVVDGGTDAGVMQLMGQARAQIKATFPLIGVTPIALLSLPNASLPNQPTPQPDAAPLETNHTHCIAIPGNQWGDESTWMSEIATLLSEGQTSVFVLINGGGVTLQDAAANIAAGRSGVVIAGSGRTADLLAAAIEEKAIAQENAHREQAIALANSGLMQIVQLEEAALTLPRQLKALLMK